MANVSVIEDRIARKLAKAEKSELTKKLETGFSVTGKRRANLARDLGFEVVEHANELWISRKLNEVMKAVELALTGKVGDPEAALWESFRELAEPVAYATELAILRRIDTEPEVMDSINSAYRLGGNEAVQAIVRQLAEELPPAVTTAESHR